MFRGIRQVVGVLAVMTILCGVIYPLVVTAIAQVAFPHQANGSLFVQDGQTVGSELIGKPFSDPKYFWPRPSATPDQPYNAASSGGSNLGPLNPQLAQQVRDRAQKLRDADPAHQANVPVDLVTASASGLDSDISVAGAEYQIPRVAKVRNLDESAVRRVVAGHTKGRQLGILGEPRVNVLAVNLALDKLKQERLGHVSRHGSANAKSR